jgi:hypothetical protein
MPLAARRVFRLGAVMALSLAVAYAMGIPLPFIVPIFALILTAPPAPPRGPRALAGLAVGVILTMGLGILLVPFLQQYPLTAVLMAAVGIYLSNYLGLNLGRGPIATLLIMGITMVSVAGSVSHLLAVTVIHTLVFALVIVVVCQWLVYPWFPEDGQTTEAAPATEAQAGLPSGTWLALRATLVVVPAYLLALTNPALYLPVIMKSVTLGQQASMIDLRGAGRELLGSTFVAGILAILFWFALGVSTNLWMFTLWMLLFGLILSARLYQVTPSRHPPSFWQNVIVTMLILLGSAVQDTANGKDVYQGFAVRMSLFIGVTVYAWIAIVFLEHLRTRRATPPTPAGAATGAGA